METFGSILLVHSNPYILRRILSNVDYCDIIACAMLSKHANAVVAQQLIQDPLMKPMVDAKVRVFKWTTRPQHTSCARKRTGGRQPTWSI